MAKIATGLWRAHRKMLVVGTHKPRDDMQRAFKHVQSVFRVLEDEQVRIRDHTGEPWIDGRAIDAIEYQPTPGLTREMITETIRPSVFCGEEHVQRAQVIVGTPMSPDNQE